MFNVGSMIDYMNFTPRTLDEILKANEVQKENIKIDSLTSLPTYRRSTHITTLKSLR